MKKSKEKRLYIEGMKRSMLNTSRESIALIRCLEEITGVTYEEEKMRAEKRNNEKAK